MKIEKNAVVVEPESCESEQNWLSYDFFEKTCSDDDANQVMHQNTFSWKNHNLTSFARIHLIFAPTRPHFYLLSPYVLTKNKKAWHCAWDMVWCKEDFIASNVSFHDILYTVRFVWTRRIQLSYFQHEKTISVGK